MWGIFPAPRHSLTSKAPPPLLWMVAPEDIQFDASAPLSSRHPRIFRKRYQQATPPAAHSTHSEDSHMPSDSHEKLAKLRSLVPTSDTIALVAQTADNDSGIIGVRIRFDK